MDSHRKTFENAWWASGCEERNGLPYLSRSAMMDYLIEKLDVSETSAKQYIKPSAPGNPSQTCCWPRSSRPLSCSWVVVVNSGPGKLDADPPRQTMMRVIHRLIHRMNPVTGNWNGKKT